MESEHRLAALEAEVKALKHEIHLTLVAIQTSLPDKPAAPSRWQKKAWVLALLNMLMAITLFSTAHFFLPQGMPSQLDATLTGWLRAFWLAMAFVWLLLQLYPLALLLEQEDSQWQGVMWRNATALFRARPSLIVELTFVLLVVAIVNVLIPAAWLIVSLIMLAGVIGLALQSLSRRQQAQEERQSIPPHLNG